MIRELRPPVLDGLGPGRRAAGARRPDCGPRTSGAPLRPGRFIRVRRAQPDDLDGRVRGGAGGGPPNAVRHAEARSVTVRLTSVPAGPGDASNVVLEVADDGRGFDPGAVAGDDHFGVRMMEGRDGTRRRLVLGRKRRGRRYSRLGFRPARGTVVSGGQTGDAVIRVFLVDDHEVVREGLRRMLERCSDIEVVGEAGSSLDALAGVDATRPQVVLLDLNLRGEAGPRRPRCPPAAGRRPPAVLILTVHDDEELVKARGPGAARGATCSSTRRYGDLATAIRRVAAGGTYYDQEVVARAPRRGAAGPTSPSTPRELDVLRLLAAGLTEPGHRRPALPEPGDREDAPPEPLPQARRRGPGTRGRRRSSEGVLE